MLTGSLADALRTSVFVCRSRHTNATTSTPPVPEMMPRTVSLSQRDQYADGIVQSNERHEYCENLAGQRTSENQQA